ncbi:hypothetical protein CEV32_1110 [Brucella rhizosphaerae]|uniref:Uncharacterized protein n=1 Tax=Brucella rhizosphaerae TaxID=571254 RepID=A0A256FDK6_9HYPH|nr:hypothetical protein CEV32_1110 [Brucella rhizosphaerae]
MPRNPLQRLAFQGLGFAANHKNSLHKRNKKLRFCAFGNHSFTGNVNHTR